MEHDSDSLARGRIDKTVLPFNARSDIINHNMYNYGRGKEGRRRSEGGRIF